MSARRIYWWLSGLNVFLVAFHVIPWLILDPSRLSLGRIACFTLAAVIFGALAWTARPRPAPRQDVGIYLYGPAGGWRYPTYRHEDA